MSKGVLIFAFDKDYCYTRMAIAAAMQVKKHLNVPVTLVTNVDITHAAIDSIIRIDKVDEQKRTFRDNDAVEEVVWLNTNRFNAYDLSPYDQTLVIDADYLMFNDSLKYLFDSDLEFACYSKVHDVTDQNCFAADERLSSISIPMLWATVMYFTKCDLAKNVFSMMQYVKANYEYYSLLYHFNSGVYRNDFALSIALQVLTGYNTKQFTPIIGSLSTVDTSAKLIHLDLNTGTLLFKADNKVSKIEKTNLHILNKHDLTHFISHEIS